MVDIRWMTIPLSKLCHTIKSPAANSIKDIDCSIHYFAPNREGESDDEAFNHSAFNHSPVITLSYRIFLQSVGSNMLMAYAFVLNITLKLLRHEFLHVVTLS